MFESCDPCRIQYNHFLRLETFKDDVIPILQLLELPTDLFKSISALNKARKTSSRTSWTAANLPRFSSNQYPHMFNALPKHDLHKFLERYHLDYQLFGYTYDKLNPKDSQSLCKFKELACC